MARWRENGAAAENGPCHRLASKGSPSVTRGITDERRRRGKQVQRRRLFERLLSIEATPLRSPLVEDSEKRRVLACVTKPLVINKGKASLTDNNGYRGRNCAAHSIGAAMRSVN